MWGVAVIQVRNSGSNRRNGHGGGGKCSYPGYTLMADPTEFPDGSDVG